MIEFFLRKKGLRLRVAAYILGAQNKILLVQQKKKAKGYWLFPGGGVEYGESVLEALRRELWEELGLQVLEAELTLINETIDPKGQRHLVQLLFLTKVAPGIPVLNPKEPALSGFGYFSIAEIQSMDLRPDIREYLPRNRKQKTDFLKTDWVD